jgi:hypothetical protein
LSIKYLLLFSPSSYAWKEGEKWKSPLTDDGNGKNEALDLGVDDFDSQLL